MILVDYRLAPENTPFQLPTSTRGRRRVTYERLGTLDGFGALTQDGMRGMWQQYVPDFVQRATPDVFSLRAASLASVAPAVVIAAEHDVLNGENAEYVRRLARDGVSATVRTYPDQFHGFLTVSTLAAEEDALNASASALCAAFVGQTTGRRDLAL